MSEYKPCPKCGATDAKLVKFTWWGGLLGPKVLTHVRCQGCRATYNGTTGRSNTKSILIFAVVALAAATVIALLKVWRTL